MLGAGMVSDIGMALAWKPVLASIGMVLITCQQDPDAAN
jgi:hypothetical protein